MNERQDPLPAQPGGTNEQAKGLLRPAGRQHQTLRVQRKTPQRATPWIVVSGGKGGVGKTVIAVNLAILCARSGYRTLLVDLDPGLPNVDVHLRLAPRHTLEDLAAERCTAHEALLEGPAGVHVLCGKSGSTRLAEPQGVFLKRTIAAVEAVAAGYDVVICDTGAGIGPSVLAAAERAAILLAVTTADPAAITDTYALSKLLLTRDIAEPRIVLNRVKNREEAMRIAGRLGAVAEKFLGQTLELCGYLRRDGLVQRSVHEQRPYGISGAGPVMEDLRALCATALSCLPAVRRSKKGSPRDDLTKLRPRRVPAARRSPAQS